MNGETPTLTSIDKKLAIICERQVHMQTDLTSMGNSFRELIETNSKRVEKHIEDESKRDTEIRDLVLGNFNQVEDNKDEIDRLRGKSNLMDTILAVGTMIAAGLGITKKG